MDHGYRLLISKINDFTRKFYLNKLLRGSMYAAALITALYLLLFTGVYYIHPGITTKTILFFSFLFVSIAAIVYWMVRPAMALFKMSKNISPEEAAKLIGNHFFTVKDKLLNTLQLKVLADQSPDNNLLILAGMDQKIGELKPVPFANAIRLQENRKYIRYILIPLSFILLIAFLAPSILKEGTSSFVQYNKEILPKAPFDFVVLNKNLNVIQGDDVTLQLKLTGNELPQDVYITEGANTYKLEKESISRFRYTFKNLQKNKELRFSAGGFESSFYTVSVKPRPSISNMSATLHYPAYLLKKDAVLQNVNDLLIPEGTSVIWKIQTENSNELLFILGKVAHQLSVENNFSQFSSTIRKSSTYQIVPKNEYVRQADSLSHQIAVIQDQFPTISLTETPDSVSSKAFYFSGHVTDDHGFSSLKFCYSISGSGPSTTTVKKSVSIQKNQLEGSFFYLWNLNTIALKPGQSLTYFFEIADNDGVNGPKVSRSEIKTYLVPTAQQVAEKISEGSQVLKKKMESAIKLAATVEKESKKLGETLLDKKELSFDDKKQIGQLLDKQKKLEETVSDIKKLNEKNTFEKEENKLLKDELAEKQKKIDDLFNNVLDQKTKELLEKLQSLMDQNNKDQTQNELSKMQMDNKSVKNELDRILELYKQLEFEQELHNKTERLKDLAKNQKDLGKKSADNKTSADELKKEQDNLSKEFKDLKKELGALEEKNQQLERPNSFENPEKETEKIEQQQKESQDQLNQNNKKKAAQSQEKAAEQMEQLAEKMEQAQEQSEEAENNVNAEELRKLLENLLNTSFEQEKVMLGLRKMSSNDPSYKSSVQKQRGIKDNMKTISDSLFALSKRVPQIEHAVTEEMQKINFNMDKGLEYLGDRQIAQAGRNQQFAMTSINNLALMLSEALEQLQNMKKNSKGAGKGKKQSMQQLQQMQQQLNQAMQKAKDQMQKSGNKGTVPKGNMSEEFAKMAQQQQMIREALQKLNREENKDGTGKMGNLNQTIKDMKSTENDLINKRIEQETINRQREVLTKMLEAEKAEREQDQDSKRESKAAKDFPPSYKQMIDKYKKQQLSETEVLQKLPPDLNYYYKNKIGEYFKLLNSAQ